MGTHLLELDLALTHGNRVWVLTLDPLIFRSGFGSTVLDPNIFVGLGPYSCRPDTKPEMDIYIRHTIYIRTYR